MVEGTGVKRSRVLSSIEDLVNCHALKGSRNSAAKFTDTSLRKLTGSAHRRKSCLSVPAVLPFKRPIIERTVVHHLRLFAADSRPNKEARNFSPKRNGVS